METTNELTIKLSDSCLRSLDALRSHQGRAQYVEELLCSSLGSLKDMALPKKIVQAQRIEQSVIEELLKTELSKWRKETSFDTKEGAPTREELCREFRFKTFRQAIQFMSQLASVCDALDHHPDWENSWKTVRVRMTTWDVGQMISNRDVQLAQFFDLYFEILD